MKNKVICRINGKRYLVIMGTQNTTFINYKDRNLFLTVDNDKTVSELVHHPFFIMEK